MSTIYHQVGLHCAVGVLSRLHCYKGEYTGLCKCFVGRSRMVTGYHKSSIQQKNVGRLGGVHKRFNCYIGVRSRLIGPVENRSRNSGLYVHLDTRFSHITGKGTQHHGTIPFTVWTWVISQSDRAVGLCFKSRLSFLQLPRKSPSSNRLWDAPPVQNTIMIQKKVTARCRTLSMAA